MSKNPTPSPAKLINLLIEERASVLHLRECCWRHIDGRGQPEPLPTAEHRNQARREIEAEVLTPRRTP